MGLQNERKIEAPQIRRGRWIVPTLLAALPLQGISLSRPKEATEPPTPSPAASQVEQSRDSEKTRVELSATELSERILAQRGIISPARVIESLRKLPCYSGPKGEALLQEDVLLGLRLSRERDNINDIREFALAFRSSENNSPTSWVSKASTSLITGTYVVLASPDSTAVVTAGLPEQEAAKLGIRRLDMSTSYSLNLPSGELVSIETSAKEKIPFSGVFYFILAPSNVEQISEFPLFPSKTIPEGSVLTFSTTFKCLTFAEDGKPSSRNSQAYVHEVHFTRRQDANGNFVWTPCTKDGKAVSETAQIVERAWTAVRYANIERAIELSPIYGDVTENTRALIGLKAEKLQALKWPEATKPTNALENIELGATFFNSDRLTLIDFGTSWCPPCRAALPRISELEREFGSQGFKAISVFPSKASDRKGLNQTAAEHSHSFAVIDDDTFQREAPLSVPTVKLYNTQGICVWAGNGAPRAEVVRQFISATGRASK